MTSLFLAQAPHYVNNNNPLLPMMASHVHQSQNMNLFQPPLFHRQQQLNHNIQLCVPVTSSSSGNAILSCPTQPQEIHQLSVQEDDQLLVGSVDASSLETPGDGGSPNCASGNNQQFYIGQIYATKDLFVEAVNTHANSEQFEVRWKITRNKRKKADEYILHRAYCPMGGKYESKKKDGPNSRPTRDSKKIGCGWGIHAKHQRIGDNSTKNAESVIITKVCLEHTNGCEGGADPDMIFALKRRAGRKYSDTALNYLRGEVKAGRYGTSNVKSWLETSGYEGVTLAEATNLRYRLLKDLPIKNWKPDVSSTIEMGEMIDYLSNEDLAKEISAGSKDSIDSLQIIHNGLKQKKKGYDFRIATDSEQRFSGTAWQTGRMRARFRKCGVMIFLDDTRSGVSTSGFCFWNVMVLDQDGKSQTVMGAMTMCASHEAAGWVLSSLVSMSPFAAEIVKATMTDLGVGIPPIQEALKSVQFFGACTWHIMSIDFPANLKHIPGYAECKQYVYQHLVHNTTCKKEWETHLMTACRKWPGAAGYLHTLSKSKERWGSAWRLDHFTLGMEASSVVEGSFSAFHRHLGGTPHSFVGVVQQHVKKDEDKCLQEKLTRVKAKTRAHDKVLQEQRTQPVNACAEIFSHQIAEKFASTNTEAQNYMSEGMSLSPDQESREVQKAFRIYKRGVDLSGQPVRIVEVIGGVYYCRWCKKDINSGQPCKHIQCACSHAFNANQFHPHWKMITTSIDYLPAVQKGISTEDCDDRTDMDGDVSAIELDSSDTYNTQPMGGGGDGVGEFVADLVENPLQTQQQHAQSKQKKLTSAKMYNKLLDQGKQLAQAGSVDQRLYNKLTTIMGYVLANIGNEEEELKEAAASYLDVEQTCPKASSTELHDINPSIKKRHQGAMSTKRKKHAVEVGVKKKRYTSCDLCKGIGHNKSTCPQAKALGKRLNKETWGCICSVDIIPDETVTEVDPQVPKDAIGVQIVGKLAYGHGHNFIYKGDVILKGLRKEEGNALYLSYDTLSLWANKGGSKSHYVFLLNK